MSIEQSIIDSAKIFSSRNSEYGESYKATGKILNAMIPDDFNPSSDLDYGKLAILAVIAGKLARYTHRGMKHHDSLIDSSVFLHMLKELDDEK